MTGDRRAAAASGPAQAYYCNKFRQDHGGHGRVVVLIVRGRRREMKKRRIDKEREYKSINIYAKGNLSKVVNKECVLT